MPFATGGAMGEAASMARDRIARAKVCKGRTPSLPLWPVPEPDGPTFSGPQGGGVVGWNWNRSARGVAGFRLRRFFHFSRRVDALWSGSTRNQPRGQIRCSKSSRRPLSGRLPLSRCLPSPCRAVCSAMMRSVSWSGLRAAPSWRTLPAATWRPVRLRAAWPAGCSAADPFATGPRGPAPRHFHPARLRPAGPVNTRKGRPSCTNLSSFWHLSARLRPAMARSIRTAPDWAPWVEPPLALPPTTTLPTARLPGVCWARLPLTRGCAGSFLTRALCRHRTSQAIRGIPRVAFSLARPAEGGRKGGRCSRRS